MYHASRFAARLWRIVRLNSRPSPASDPHAALCARGDASVAAARPAAERDPLRPVYHLAAPAFWINDPNGPVFHAGRYHMFFQHNPYGSEWGNMSWAHAASLDLVRWKHLPIALAPTPGACDKDGIFSGCCVIRYGVPTILYTGVSPEVQCIATSDDDLIAWTKRPATPVIAARPRDDLEGFRDPFVWKEPDAWYMVLGSGIKGLGGTALLYRSPDLLNWDYLHPLCVGFGTNWECPNFFPLGGRHVLVVSPHGDVQYAVGAYAGRRFVPDAWHPLDLGGASNFYAPNCLQDPSGRRIMWGWARGGGTPGAPWNGCLTLPRVLTLRPDHRLGIEPLPELKTLRGTGTRRDGMRLGADERRAVDAPASDCMEIAADIEPGSAQAIALELREPSDGGAGVAVTWDRQLKRLSCGQTGGAFEPGPGEDVLRLRVFVDKSVLEIYANGTAVLTARVYPRNREGFAVSLVATGGTATARRVEVWPMKTIWDT